MSLVTCLAEEAPVPVFLLVGDGGSVHARRLQADSRLHLTESPRHATVLLVLGSIPPALHEAARQVHARLPPPRATVALVSDERAQAPFPVTKRIEDPEHLTATVVSTHRALMSGALRSESGLGPEENPVPWRGVGPHGQGGEGMMGGKPYGRAMAMMGIDIRDGLQQDRVSLPLGPFLRWLPPGIYVDLALQGDVVQQARVHAAPFAQRDDPDVFQRALREPVSVAELELARARHHLFATASLLRLHALDAQSLRIARLALRLRVEDERGVRTFARWLRWTGALRLGTRGVGVLCADELEPYLGPLARAAGIREDARARDPAYQGLGFSPLSQTGGDCEARFQQRLGEAAQALAIARRAGDRVRSPGPPLEGPRGIIDEPIGPRLRELLERSVRGQSFDAFATTLVSFDLDASTIHSKTATAARSLPTTPERTAGSH